MSLFSDIASGTIKKKVYKWILLNVIGPLIIILLICAIPLLIIESIGNSFSLWFSGKESNYSSKTVAFKDWVNSLDKGFSIGEGYITKDGLIKYIDAEGSTYIGDKTIKVKESVTEYTSSSKEGSVSSTSNYTQTKDYTIPFSSVTSEYVLPWQLMSIMNATSLEPYTDDFRDSIVETFKTNFFGLFSNDEETAITSSDITNDKDYRFLKKVTTTVTITETIDPASKPPTSREEYYKQLNEKPYTVTKTTVTTAEYPLPYFTRIETLKNDITFEYEVETTVNPSTTTKSGNKTIVSQTTVTQPVLKEKSEIMDTYGFFGKLKSIGLATSDTSYLQEQLLYMPDGERFAGYFNDVIPLELNSFDMYYGTDFGAGKLKLSGLGRFGWPANVAVNVCSAFGYRIHPVYKVLKFHQGIDIDCNVGTDIYAADHGEVVFTGLNGGFGNLVVIKHSDNLYTYYGHLFKIIAKKGDKVNKGDVIALSGGARGAPGSGTSTGPHLHFEVRRNMREPLDPSSLLGLVPDVVDINQSELKYKPLNIEKIRNYLKKKNSKIAEAGYLEKLDSIAKEANINPALMIAITGQEMSYVKNDYTYWVNVYGRANLLNKLKKLNKDAQVEEAPGYIINNPWNVYHSWWEYNKSFEASAKVCSTTLKNLSKGCPSGMNPILWINNKGGAGLGYAQDNVWWLGVSRLFSEINSM